MHGRTSCPRWPAAHADRPHDWMGTFALVSFPLCRASRSARNWTRSTAIDLIQRHFDVFALINGSASATARAAVLLNPRPCGGSKFKRKRAEVRADTEQTGPIRISRTTPSLAGTGDDGEIAQLNRPVCPVRRRSGISRNRVVEETGPGRGRVERSPQVPGGDCEQGGTGIIGLCQ